METPDVEFSNICRVTFNVILHFLVTFNLLLKLHWKTGSICNPLISAPIHTEVMKLNTSLAIRANNK